MNRTFEILCLIVTLAASSVFAQTSARLSDKDVERLMKNINEDSKRFAESFKKAISKSTVRKTSRAKEAKEVAERFVNQTEGMARNFDQSKKADTSLPVVYQTAGEIDKWLQELSLQGVVTSQWQKVKTELDQVAQQFSYTPSR